MPPRVSLVLLCCLVGGCVSQPERPALPAIDTGTAFSLDLPRADVADAAESTHWWQRAVEPAVASDLETALAANPELRRAQYGIEASRASLIQAAADRGPTATLAAGANSSRSDSETVSGGSVGANASMPLDLNGALAHRHEAARHELAARIAAREQLLSDLARDYLLALADHTEARQRLLLLDEQLALAGTLLDLIELRFTQGLASSVDVLQQRDQQVALRQQLPTARLDSVTSLHRLRRIAGLTPDRSLQTENEYLLSVNAGFLETTPGSLLQSRADLRAAQARLRAADATFAAALADQLPSLDLSGGLLRAVSSGDYRSVINLALDAAFTLFDGGYKRAVAEQRRSELAIAGEAYLIDWLDATIEADRLMHEEASLRERIDLSEQRLGSAQILLRASQRRYQRGIGDYLPVLEALRGLQQQQRADLELRAALARVRIRLHHALGMMKEDAT